MSKYALRGLEIIPIEQANVSLMTGVVNYGLGCFEGIRGYWDDASEELFLFRLQEHLERLWRSSRILHIRLPGSVADVATAICGLVREEGFQEDIYVRPLAFKTSLRVGGRLDDLEDDFVAWASGREKADPCRERGIRVSISGWRRVNPDAIPPQAKLTGTYISSFLSRTAAKVGGYDDCILVNGTGHVAEGSGWNVFLRKGDTLITPATTEGILEGITRATVLEMAQKELGMVVQERQVSPSELLVADEVIGTGTGVQLYPVVEIDGWKIGDGRPGELFTRLWDLYGKVVRNRVPAYGRWLTPVYAGHR